LVRESEVSIEYKAKVSSQVSGVEKRVVHFSKLLFKSDKKKFSLGRVSTYGSSLAVIQEDICCKTS